MTLEKHRLSLAVVRDTRVAMFASSKQNYLQARLQSYNGVNKISGEIIHYKAMDAKYTREALKHQAREATLMRKSISVQASSASRLEKWQG